MVTILDKARMLSPQLEIQRKNSKVNALIKFPKSTLRLFSFPNIDNFMKLSLTPIPKKINEPDSATTILQNPRRKG